MDETNEMLETAGRLSLRMDAMVVQLLGPSDSREAERADYIDALCRSGLPCVIKALMYELVLRASFDVKPWKDPKVSCAPKDVASAVGLDCEAVGFCLGIAEESGYLKVLVTGDEMDQSWFELHNPEKTLLGMWQQFAEHHEPVRDWELFRSTLYALLAENAPAPEP
ncbi:hypothetical protein [Streptomyces kronopolitis]|uniref:hypothetical protein n=1 Tax=Streptomyces kronopolitis TaxID=1612435 RepID=UPI0020BD8E7C|nr:hypothetical protein [Streptomyces kronopolitis]MCL6301363.1 hypothetical protein [Streptomyces kronopolitis]